MRKPPKQKPGQSEQIVGTPPEFLEAIRGRFGAIDVDLAATKENAVAPIYYTEEQDSLAQDWTRHRDRVCFLNPPFAHIEPWAAKCAHAAYTIRRGCILLLTPACVSTGWFRRHVFAEAMVLAIPRMKFVGHSHQFPKDLMLSVFSAHGRGFDVWDWRNFAECPF